MQPTPLAIATLAGVILSWFFFVGIFLFRKRPEKAPEAKSDKTARLGIILQMVGFFLVWFQPPHQPFLPPVAVLSGVSGIAFGVFTVALAAGSAWLIESAIRTLGKQWALRARLVEGHQLITSGPFAYIRNPIYTGMLGMLIASGLAMEHWVALIFAVVIFSIGLYIRVRTEEKLLRSEFGAQFEEYAKKVSAVVPGIY